MLDWKLIDTREMPDLVFLVTHLYNTSMITIVYIENDIKQIANKYQTNSTNSKQIARIANFYTQILQIRVWAYRRSSKFAVTLQCSIVPWLVGHVVSVCVCVCLCVCVCVFLRVFVGISVWVCVCVCVFLYVILSESVTYFVWHGIWNMKSGLSCLRTQIFLRLQRRIWLVIYYII